MKNAPNPTDIVLCMICINITTSLARSHFTPHSINKPCGGAVFFFFFLLFPWFIHFSGRCTYGRYSTCKFRRELCDDSAVTMYTEKKVAQRKCWRVRALNCQLFYHLWSNRVLLSPYESMFFFLRVRSCRDISPSHACLRIERKNARSDRTITNGY